MPTLGPTELIVILVVVILLFGAKKLPELARSVGDSMKELRKGFSDDASKDKKTTTQQDNETS